MTYQDWTFLAVILIVVFFVGLFGGMALTKYAKRGRKETDGVLYVDYSDYDGPYTFLELHKSLGDIVRQNTVTLEVSVTKLLDDPIPQK